MTEWMLVVGMVLLTFIPRYLPFALAGKVSIPAWLSQALNFVPIAVLTIIIVQSTLIRDQQLSVSLQNYHLIAAIIAFVVAVITRHLFLTIVIGLVSFAVIKQFSVFS